MLFQHVLERVPGAARGFDVEQMHIVLEEEIATAAFTRAWTLVARRHPALTTSLRWEGVQRPSQHPNPTIFVPVETHDWRTTTAAERARKREEFLASDRKRGFDLSRPPLMRVTVFAMGEGRTEVVWTFHHVLIDGRSMAPVLAEVFATYAGLVGNDDPPAPPAPRPYRDYIDWLARYPAKPHGAFFRTLLAGKSNPTPLPCAEPASRPLAREGYGELGRRVDAGVAAAARELARTTATTMAVVLEAAWALVLSRLTGDSDVVFGATRACRRTALDGEADAMIGLFMNTLPMRARIDDDASVRALLAELRRQGVAMRDHEHAQLAEIRAYGEYRGGAPLFETLFLFENREINRVLAAHDPRWKTRTCSLHEQPSVPLTLSIVDDEHLDVRILFDRRRFRDRVVERILDYVTTTLEQLTRGADLTLGEVDVLPPAERHRVLKEWNDTSRPFPDELCIHEPFEARAGRQPAAVAAEMNGVTLTYQALEARANQLAHALRARGAGPGRYVAVCLGRGLDLVVALLGVAKSGAAYVPLDPDYPRERLDHMQADTESLLVLTEQRFRPLFVSNVMVLDGEHRDEIATMPTTRLGRLSSPTDVCYVIFTSGSTGKPKGVVLSHRAVINTFDWVTRTLEVGPGDRLLFVTSPCFDLSVYDVFGALGAGATVVVAGSALMKDARALAEAIVLERITIWDSAPASLQRLVPFLPPSSRRAPLRLVMLSGDWIPITLPDEIRRAFPAARVVSLGGATEAAIWSNWFPVGALDPKWASIPYGRPIQNARYHVLDARMRPTPIGVAGDLYIGGACLAEGYLNRPELTAERFVPDPFAERPGERLYRTGDLARYFDNGDLEFLGRSDFQVKIRGFRIELGEIEAALSSLAGVRQAACGTYVDASGQKSLIAYVVPTDGQRLDERALLKSLATKLPDFMVPSQAIVLAAMPISSNGKLDRAALPSPNARAAGEQFAPPETVKERAMAVIWEEVLQRKQIGVTDDFFELGGHSLLAVMLVSRVKNDMGLDLPLSRVLERPTIRALAASFDTESPATSVGRHVVTFNAEGKGPPLVLCSGGGGYGFVFQGLAASLGPDQPVHVLDAVGADDDREGTEHSIEEIAEIYEPQVLAACRGATPILGGYSLGMLVAFELANRFRRRGIEVPLLCSFDGFAPGFPTLLPFAKRIGSHARVFFGGDLVAKRAYLRDRYTRVKGRVLERLGRAHEGFAIPDDVTDAVARDRMQHVVAGLWHARCGYHPSDTSKSNLLLIKTANPSVWLGNSFEDPLYGWSAFVTGQIGVAVVPGEHLRMFEDPRALVDILAPAIAQVRSSS